MVTRNSETRGKRKAVNNLSKMTDANSSRSDGEEDEPLLPGLPDEIVLNEIVPKLTWRGCRILSMVSRCWREAYQVRDMYGARVRAHATETLFVLNYITKRGNNNQMSLYSMKDNLWYRLPPFPKPQKPDIAIQYVSLDGKIYVIGGLTNLGNVNDVSRKVFVLDLAGGQMKWKRCANMPSPGFAFGCGVVDRKIYVFGGFNALGSQVKDDSDWADVDKRCDSLVYDPTTNAWSSRRPMKRGSSYYWVAGVGQELFVYSPHAGIEVYRVDKDEWESLEPGRKTEQLSSGREMLYTQGLRNVSGKQRLFTVQGILHMATPLGIYRRGVGSDGICCWTRLHSFSDFEEQNDDDLGFSVFVGEDELLALVVHGYETSLYRSNGFGGEKEEITWDRLAGDIMTCCLLNQLFVPIQI